MNHPIPLKGFIQHYDWGGHTYLAQLLGSTSPSNRPWAEWWLGDHPRGPNFIDLPEGTFSLPQWLVQEKDCTERAWPFLLKVLDVQHMLSIQAHPDLATARQGFARENEAGVPLAATHRVYRDDNHKPELMVALTDFYLLHGFAPKSLSLSSLERFDWMRPLTDQLRTLSLKESYALVMHLPQSEVDAYLLPLRDRLLLDFEQGTLQDTQPDYWAAMAFLDARFEAAHPDRGIFSIYLLNLVRLSPGEGIFQGPGVLHAYLRGACVEIMACSDNVFRGGLTRKHIDIEQLLTHVVYDEITPHIIQAEAVSSGCWAYPHPADDFRLCRWQLHPGEYYSLSAQAGWQVGFVLDGQVQIGDHIFHQGEAWIIPPGNTWDMRTAQRTICFVASAEP